MSKMYKQKCVYNSTNEMTSFYDCKKCKACCHVFNIPFKDQKPTIMLFGGGGTHCFARKTSRDYEKEQPSPLLKKLFSQSQPSTFGLEPKKEKFFHLWHNRVYTSLVETVNRNFIYILILYNFSLN